MNIQNLASTSSSTSRVGNDSSSSNSSTDVRGRQGSSQTQNTYDVQFERVSGSSLPPLSQPPESRESGTQVRYPSDPDRVSISGQALQSSRQGNSDIEGERVAAGDDRPVVSENDARSGQLESGNISSASRSAVSAYDSVQDLLN